MFRKKAVVQRAGVTALDKAEVPLESLSLNPERRYYAYDYWNEKGFYVCEGILPLDALELGDTSVIALTIMLRIRYDNGSRTIWSIAKVTSTL